MTDITLTLNPDMEKYLITVLDRYKADMKKEGAESSYRVEILEMLLQTKKLSFKKIAHTFKDTYGDDFDPERFAKSWERITDYNGISEDLKKTNEDYRQRILNKLEQYEDRLPLVDASFTTSVRSKLRETCKRVVLTALAQGGISSVQELEKKALNICRDKYGDFSRDVFIHAFVTALGVASRYNTGQKQNRVMELVGIMMF